MLAIMQVGSVYVPLDPSFPVSYKQFLVEDSEACVVLCEDEDNPVFGSKTCGLPPAATHESLVVPHVALKR